MTKTFYQGRGVTVFRTAGLNSYVVIAVLGGGIIRIFKIHNAYPQNKKTGLSGPVLGELFVLFGCSWSLRG